MNLSIGVVGCGAIGARRARVAHKAGDRVRMVADIDERRAREIAVGVGADWTGDWRQLVSDSGIDAVVVSTFNSALVPVTIAALRCGKHVLCEKPLGRSSIEALKVLDIARKSGTVLKVGFTLRHHPAIVRAHELAERGEIGPVITIRAAYGHGGRPGYEREWRGDPELAGGGELLDQGVHVVDLCRWFMGDFAEVTGMLATLSWDVSPLEDNGFALLRTANGGVATLHTSWTQWKNLFRFEVFGGDGYVIVEGLGGSYGRERLTLGRRRPESGPPTEKTWSYAADDVAWEAEWNEFVSVIGAPRDPSGSANDGYEAARIIDAIYESARRGRTMKLETRP